VFHLKSGQIGIVLVVIVILGILFGLLYALLPGFSSFQSDEFQSAETYVTGILKETAEHCISLIGMRGSRVSQSQFASFPFGEVEASFQDAPVFLTRADLGDELSDCVEARLSVCSEGNACRSACKIDPLNGEIGVQF